MPFLIYLAVAAVAVFSVALEWHSLVEPSAATRQAMQAVTRVQAPKADAENTRRADAAVIGKNSPVDAARTPAQDQSADAKREVRSVGQASADASQGAAGEASLAQPTETAAARCDADACAQAYRSFRAADCTYQPFEGERQLCTKGAARLADEAANARAQSDTPALPRCHYRSCAEHYSSFNPADCTYQPFDGPRRLCKK